MKIPFYKIHGAGNDCIVFHGTDVRGGSASKKRFVQKISHRNLGIGCDQVLEILSLDPLAIQIWNCDGSKAEMCGNGARAFAALAKERNWIKIGVERVPLQISGHQYHLQEYKGSYAVSLGEPRVEKEKSFSVRGQRIPYVPVSVGNPHAVIFMTGKEMWRAPRDFDSRVYGAAIECHRQFPMKTNVEFVKAAAKKKNGADLLVEFWERGAGATLSCGSGAVAVAAAYRRKFMPQAEEIRVRMNAFWLVVRFDGTEAFLSGPTEFVAEGNFFYT